MSWQISNKTDFCPIFNFLTERFDICNTLLFFSISHKSLFYNTFSLFVCNTPSTANEGLTKCTSFCFDMGGLKKCEIYTTYTFKENREYLQNTWLFQIYSGSQSLISYTINHFSSFSKPSTRFQLLFCHTKSKLDIPTRNLLPQKAMFII